MKLGSALGAPSRELTYEGDTFRFTDLLGPPAGKHDSSAIGPQSYYVEWLSGKGLIKVHFHEVDQFQLFIGGDGKFGRNPIQPLYLHYVDAFTPYGPILPGPIGYRFVTIRDTADQVGVKFMPESRGDRKRFDGRQIHSHYSLSEHQFSAGPEWTTLIPPQPDGLAAHVVSAGPGQDFENLSRTAGGTHILVVKGSLSHQGEEHPPPTTLYLAAQDAGTTLKAGPAGAVCALLSFGAWQGESH